MNYFSSQISSHYLGTGGWRALSTHPGGRTTMWLKITQGTRRAYLSPHSCDFFLTVFSQFWILLGPHMITFWVPGQSSWCSIGVAFTPSPFTPIHSAPRYWTTVCLSLVHAWHPTDPSVLVQPSRWAQHSPFKYTCEAWFTMKSI